ncbi:hypothetical protein CXB51_028131 [Gossypium anomalum]|uniref:WRKY domain-containing protein n=1 Tax=Gossypium anomalum TaxID=47600 RepID=A0A8J6CSI1_9ROSI|nr:hypothetical protein CXB51_028131 [Gossypium anomalum]
MVGVGCRRANVKVTDMAVELMMSCRNGDSFAAKMEENAVKEAASGLESVEKLIRLLSQTQQQQQSNSNNQEKYQASSISTTSNSLDLEMDCKAEADAAVSRFKRVISLLGRTRTGHARFRRAPVQPNQEQETKVYYATPIQQIPPPVTTAYPLPPPPPPHHHHDFMTVSSAGKPPLSSSSSFKRKCSSDNLGSGKCTSGSSGRCHCSKKRKLRSKRVVRVPAISLKMADIPPDDYSWRKYGQKPIKGSPHPRGYYKCSSVRGCPARKHVERALDDPSMLVVTYEGEHNHSLSVAETTNLILESS